MLKQEIFFKSLLWIQQIFFMNELLCYDIKI